MHPLHIPIREINVNLESLRDFVDVLGSLLNEKAQESAKIHAPLVAPLLLALSKGSQIEEGIPGLRLNPRTAELLAQYQESSEAKVEKGEDGISLRITLSLPQGHDLNDLGTAMREMRRVGSRTRMLHSSSLLNLTSSVELFFSKLLHQYYDLHPEAIGTKEKIFSFDDLSKFENVSEARSHYVSSKIEDLLRGSLSEWLAFAKNTIKLSMGYLGGDQGALEETFQRRNVVVHNGGIANSIYLAKVPEKLRPDVEAGDDLAPDEAYLNDRIDLWETTCILIAAELWKQLVPNDGDRATVLIDVAYKHLVAERWRVAEAISTFMMRDKQMPETMVTAAQLNFWQCRKWMGEWTTIEKEAESADYSAKSLRFQLAHLALLGRADDFFALLPRALKSDEITETDLREFPIFREIRADARFQPYAVPKPRRRRRRVPPSVSGDSAEGSLSHEPASADTVQSKDETS